MSERYLTAHCRYCGGGIEFPDHGVGAEIACPHCQKPITLEAEQKAAAPFSRGGLLFLSKFRFPTTLESLSQPNRWEGVLDRPASEVASIFVEAGLLEHATLRLAESLARQSSKRLQELAKERGLGTTGTKAALGKRLAQADPSGMEQLVSRETYFHCTVRGRELAEAFLKSEHDAEQKAIADALMALRQENVERACELITTFKNSRSVGRGLEAAQTEARDLMIMQIIFSERLTRHSALNERQLLNIRVAAAMLQLMGTNRVQPYLEDGLSKSDIDWDAESRMVLSRGIERANLAQMKAVGIKRVEVLGSDGCPACAADNKKVFNIETAPILPHEDCVCEDGCMCMITAAG